MTAKDFYEITNEQLNKLAELRGIKDLSKYYELTDFLEGSFINNYKDKAQVFAQIAYHAQNATMLSNIVSFEDNIEFLSNTFCEFEPKAFLDKYCKGEKEDSVTKIVNDLRFNENTNTGIKWNSAKSKEENKDKLIIRYAKTLIEAAQYVDSFENRASLLDDLKSHYKDKDYNLLLDYFHSKVTCGFSIALSCDFLKEFDDLFHDLPKPDIHIMDTLCAYKGYDKGYYNSLCKVRQCIHDMQELVNEINITMSDENKITVYKLDRMIWLICSENFYLDKNKGGKNTYLNLVRKK